MAASISFQCFYEILIMTVSNDNTLDFNCMTKLLLIFKHMLNLKEDVARQLTKNILFRVKRCCEITEPKCMSENIVDDNWWL